MHNRCRCRTYGRQFYFVFREQEKEIAEREQALLNEQELQNRVRNKDFGAAITLALELKRPQQLWAVLRDTMTERTDDGVLGPAAAGDAGKWEDLNSFCCDCVLLVLSWRPPRFPALYP